MATVQAAASSVSSGSLQHFEEFFRAEFPRLVRAVAVIARDPQDAEELVQEAMVRAYLRWSRVGRLSSPAGYVFRTATNLHKSRMRRLAVWRRRAPAAAPCADEANQAVARTDLLSALRALPDGQRDAFMLVEWFGMTSQDAGELLAIAPGSVRSRVARAKAALATALGVPGGNDV